MRKKFKKALSLFLVFILMLGIMIPTISEIAEAKTYYVKHTYISGSNTFGYPNTFGEGQKVTVGKGTNKRVGFCIEPGVKGTTGSHNTIKPSDIGITEEKINELSLIAWYGYRSKKASDVNYCLTQSLIWKELGSPKRIGIGKYQSNSDMQDWFDSVMKKVNSFYDKPSFNKKTYTINAGATKSIKDTKGVLSGLNIKSVTGGKATISGNTLKVTPDGKSDTMQIIFDRNLSAEQTKTQFVLKSGNAQAVSVLTGQDPYKAFINVKVNLNGKAEVTKKSESGKAIKGAKFNIKNADGSVNKNGTTDENGKILFSNLAPGTYTVTETSVPSPYLIDKTPKTVTVKANDTGEVSFTNNLPRGEFTLTKTKENGSPLVGAKFRIWSVGNDPEGNAIGYDNTFTTNKNGKINVTGLKLGTYNYQEIAAPNGYILDSTVRSFNLTYKNSLTSVVTSTGSVKNMMPRGEFKLVKNGVDGSKLAGAEYRVWSVGSDPEGTAINFDKVFTTDKNGELNVTGLKLGAYKYKEVKAPTGYVLDKTVGDFTLSYKDQNTAIVGTSAKRVDKRIEVKKLDVNGKLVAGAELKVVDKDNKVVDSWTSTGDVHKISNLKEGESYTLVEVKAPAGYVLANPVPFTVTTDKEDQTVTMIDKQVEFIKTDVDGNALSGMEYTITHNKSKQIVDKGITSSKNRNFLNGLQIGETYTITETKTPKDFVTAKPLEFTVTEDNELQTVTMIDKQVTVKKTDLGGENVVGAELKVVDKETGDVIDSWTVKEGEPEHIVQGLIEGKEYTLIEDYAPEGFTISNSIDFTVTKDKVNQTVAMIDKIVDVDKVNVDGESLKGVKLQIVNKKTKQIVDEWITDGNPHKVSLVEGMEYTLIELESIEGYVLAAPFDFTVTYDKETQHIVMTDKKVQFKKLGRDDKTLTGGKFEIKDKETGDVVDTISAEKDFIDIDNLVEGKTYIITETKAPYGYEIGEDVEFTVTYDKKTQKLVMKDIPKEGRIIVTDNNGFGGDEWYEVETGDKFGLAMLLMLLIASGIGTVVLGADRKKKHR